MRRWKFNRKKMTVKKYGHAHYYAVKILLCRVEGTPTKPRKLKNLRTCKSLDEAINLLGKIAKELEFYEETKSQ